MRQITERQIEQAREKNLWTLGNQVLYDLCAQYPNHNQHDEIIAKIWLIGRSYAAAVERRKNSDKTMQGESFYEQYVAPAIRKSEIDNYLQNLQIYQDVDAKSIDDILKTHKYLVDILMMLTGQNNRSLVSKYLHFHLPNLFFIYDSRAYYALREYKSFLKSVSTNEAYDYDYHKFCLKCLELQNDIYKQYGVHLTPREVDNLLLQS